MIGSPWGAEAAQRAAAAVRARLQPGGESAPAAALILGSGLGTLASELEGARRVPFADVPGFPGTTVAGHAGALIAGRLGGRPILALAGRFHLYEGHEPALAAFPVRVLHALGATVLFVSNAAGGVRRTFAPGTLMRIADHINLTWRHPLIGPTGTGEARFPDFSAPYDAELGARMDAAARAEGIPLEVGVYGGLTGPSYETPAEVRMLDWLGVDAVGMSTVPEVIVARALGMRVAGVSCISNRASGLSPAPLDHADVLAVTARIAERFRALVRAWVGTLD
jgi:purine-nucleoside phosphorylase